MAGALVLIGGPIGAGKSSVARELARKLGRRERTAAVIDLDLVYEMLDAEGAVKDDPRLWGRSRRLAASMADALLSDGVEVVIVEGDVLHQDERMELADAMRTRPRRLDVTLRLPLAVALERVAGDPTRGLSRDPAFLAGHYESLEDALRARPATELVLDTACLSVPEASERIANALG
jgi:adenylylsulfate kinase-like enzyme